MDGGYECGGWMGGVSVGWMGGVSVGCGWGCECEWSLVCVVI